MVKFGVDWPADPVTSNLASGTIMTRPATTSSRDGAGSVVVSRDLAMVTTCTENQSASPCASRLLALFYDPLLGEMSMSEKARKHYTAIPTPYCDSHSCQDTIAYRFDSVSNAGECS
jgi:hypothetical protein